LVKNWRELRKEKEKRNPISKKYSNILKNIGIFSLLFHSKNFGNKIREKGKGKIDCSCFEKFS
jgi:hypothetical protein